jgi:hypothetical protein
MSVLLNPLKASQYAIWSIISAIKTSLWRPWLHPWIQPVPGEWCAAPRVVHSAPSQPLQQRCPQRQWRPLARIDLWPCLFWGQRSWGSPVETLATPLDPTGSRGGGVSCTTWCTPCYLYSQQPVCIYSAMYSVLNQCCPNCCPAYCSSTSLI